MEVDFDGKRKPMEEKKKATKRNQNDEKPN